MGIIAVASLYNGKSIIGYRLLDTTSNVVKDASLASVVSVLNNGKVGIDNLDVLNNNIIGSNGSVDRLPKIVNGKLKGDSSLTIINQLGDQGYTVSDYKGQILKLRENDVISYAKSHGISNGKVVSKDGAEFISSISGEYKKVEIDVKEQPKIDDKSIEKQKELQSKLDELSKSVIKRVSLSKEIMCNNGMTVEQKIARSIIQMKKTHAFYSAIYTLLERIENQSIKTMGVTSNQLHYNPNFVAQLSESELNFINLHEICHIAMMHHLRLKDRNAKRFNIACDLFINKILCEEFGVTPGKNVTINGVDITCPTNGCYDERVDTKTETPESIYDIMTKNKDERNKQNEKGQKSNEQGDSQDTNDSEENDTEGEEKEADTTEIYRDRKYRISDDKKDIMKSDNDKNRSAEEVAVKQLLEQAMIRSYGVGSGNLMRLVKDLLAPKINWKKLFRNKLIEATQSITTMAHPDKRFMSRYITLPGPKKLDPDKINGVKICIDTSGSISDTDLGVAYRQIKDMLDTYKVGAEVIYWDTKVANKEDFKNIKEFLNIQAKGGGGTDANCIFEYFESKECKIKPSVVIVFTDGCFGQLEQKYKRKYRDTIWVINSNPSFEPPFGKVAPLSNVI